MKRAPLLLPLALAGCNDMSRQPREDAYEASPLFPGGTVMQAAPAGTVARDQPLRDAAERTPPPLTPALLARGAERYAIACAPCHGIDGRGQGFVTTRGYPHPRSFLEPGQRAMSASHVYDVITRGYGVMYAHADRVKPADRWAIAAHVRVLQAAQEPGDAR